MPTGTNVHIPQGYQRERKGCIPSGDIIHTKYVEMQLENYCAGVAECESSGQTYCAGAEAFVKARISSCLSHYSAELCDLGEVSRHPTICSTHQDTSSYCTDVEPQGCICLQSGPTLIALKPICTDQADLIYLQTALVEPAYVFPESASATSCTILRMEHRPNWRWWKRTSGAVRRARGVAGFDTV